MDVKLAGMELLERPAGVALGPPRVISSPSMTMKFSLPASYLKARAARPVAPAMEQSKGVNINEDSWEQHDWEAPTIQPPVNKVESDSESEWEQETPELPDDFPRLIVNLTRVQHHHFPSPKQAEGDEDMMELFQRVKSTVQEHFSQLAEVLFEQKSCFHCTYGTARAMMDGLHEAYPEDFFAMVDYPTEIDGEPLHEFLHVLSTPSKWKSVEYLKDCLRRCSRDIRWKRDVTTELELLAEQEFAQYEEKQKQLGDEIDELTRLRDSFREKLAKMASQEGKPKGQYLMLRKLEDIENRLMTLLDDYLAEPELEERECYSAFGNPGGEGGVTTGMNVLDMVIAMVFGRLPRDFSQQTTTEEHFQQLFDHHIHMLRLWKKDFGRLPLKSRVSAPKADGSDGETPRESSEEDEAVPDESDENELEQGAGEFSLHSGVDDGDVGGSDMATNLGGDDDWEDVYAEDTRRSFDEPIRKETHDDSDGYGADVDSDESEDEDEQGQAQMKHKFDEAKPPDAATAAVPAPARPRRRRIKHTRRSKKLQQANVERYESDGEREPAPFQPFACTGAVGLLRLAKENELF